MFSVECIQCTTKCINTECISATTEKTVCELVNDPVNVQLQVCRFENRKVQHESQTHF